MSTNRRAGLVLGLAIALVAAFAAYLLHQVSLRRAAAIDSAIENGPLTVSVSLHAGYAPPGSSWDLEVDSSGRATWTNDGNPARVTRRFVVTKTQQDDLRKALLRERFFDLSDSYGKPIIDAGTTTIEVTAGDFSKKVDLVLSANWTEHPDKFRETSRAMRVFDLVRGWSDAAAKAKTGKK